ncbi:CBS domain-containing protein [Priestia megaterium]|jgi:CBS domain-containing protein|uniref:CBS domain-containing protein n=1 Tax=Priestia TaxID=2800373 RepID=UPI00094D71B1|nr:MULTISPECIES: CBS domain-containing protein [Priestia]MBY0090076.1 CBS domain-containing protein [Priestia aryabhattai]MBY0100334.1 CBS domain-containing protein [Priestia aryabhattai]MCM3303473.1 CBS domain-containing protein [Priestia megaterium]MED4028834.1 CBS domain-containing protein [Priestia megaterium]MED4136718.1 CBS domain-containing protein [Priestia megaterium]
MNIAFFLVPKSDVVTLNIQSTLRQALEKMEYHRYSTVPLVDDDGKYVGVLTEGDLLWKLKSLGDYRFQDTENIKLTEIDRYQDYNPVAIYDEVQNILSKAIDQNFVPVTDDQGVFIGIVRRREILEFYAESASKVKNKI